MSNPILSSLLEKVDQPDMLKKLTDVFSNSELNTLLLALFENKAAGVSPAALLENYRNNRFVRPSSLDPLKLMQFKMLLHESACQEQFESLEISPLAPFGCCSALAPVDQDKVVSALRGTEVLSDGTNVLALEAAIRRKADSAGMVKLCCSARHVRAQSFDNPDFSAHFDLFCMVTAGKDTGSYTFEKEAMVNQLTLYFKFLKDRTGKSPLKLVVKPLIKDKKDELCFQGVSDHLKNCFPDRTIEFQEEHAGFSYYSVMRFNLMLRHKDAEHLIVDGGFTDWTQKLMNNRKERLLTSGLGIEYLFNLMG
jgi:hypothetical protein